MDKKFLIASLSIVLMLAFPVFVIYGLISDHEYKSFQYYVSSFAFTMIGLKLNRIARK